jgi:hypothetical protein
MANKIVKLQEIENKMLRRGRRGNTNIIKKSPSNFDIPLDLRSYWNSQGKDYSLLESLVRMRIVKTVSRGLFIELGNDADFLRLEKDDREALIKYQIDLILGNVDSSDYYYAKCDEN